MAEVNPNSPINSKESTDLTLANGEETKIPAHKIILASMSQHLTSNEQDEDETFPCEKCDHRFPNDKKAKLLHMSSVHGENLIKYTPGPVKQKRTPIPPFKCESCEYTCRSKPSLKRHVTMIHSSNKVEKVKENKKRPFPSVTCPTCQSTFASKIKMKKHVESEHEDGKKEDSPQRKIAKTADLNSRIVPDEQMEGEEKEECGNNKTTNNKIVTETQISLMQQTIESQKIKIESLEQENSKWNGEDLEEIKGMRNRIQANNRTMMGMEQENKNLVEEVKLTKERYKSEVVELEKYISEEAKATVIKVKKLENIVLQKNEMIDKLNLELRKFKVPKPTPTATPVEIITEVRGDNASPEISIKCKECDFIGKTWNELTDHKWTNCSEALIQKLIEHDNNEQNINGRDNSNEEVVADNHESWQKQGRHRLGFNCPICGLTRKSKMQIEQHMASHDKDEDDSQFNCDKCPYQTINRDQLLEHIERTHESNSTEYICNLCNITFQLKRELNKHNKENHRTFYKPCRNFPSNNCQYNTECNFYHVVLNQGEHICYKCGDVFENKTHMMNHIKSVHGDEICKRFIENKCTFGERCFFKHISTAAQNAENISRETPSQQVFYNLPIAGQQTPVMGEQDQKMFNMMNQMMSQMMIQLSIQKK